MGDAVCGRLLPLVDLIHRVHFPGLPVRSLDFKLILMLTKVFMQSALLFHGLQ